MDAGPKKIIFTVILLFVSAVTGLTQKYGNLTGHVINVETNYGIPDVTAKITELQRTVQTDSTGLFIFDLIPPASYTLSFMAPGYGRTVLLNVQISADKTRNEIIYMQKSADEDEKFYIGGIEVTADRELIPDGPVTSTRITSGEIEHLQASSLGDVLEFIPGQKFTNPGLEDVKQIGLRHVSTVDDADRNTALGTQIIVDDIPLSNNANMQLDTKLNDGANYRININAGIDLRQIPAENIKSVEVIRGIPPARYGDLTSGAILVETTSGYSPFRAKYKYNPRTNELNLAGGYAWAKHQLNFNVNYASSLRDIRVQDNTYSRIALQLNLLSRFSDDRIEWSNRFYITRTFDEQDVREGDVNKTERYNRDYITRFVTNIQNNWSRTQHLSLTASVNMNQQNSFFKKIASSDIHIIGTRMTPGVEEGHFISSYVSELWVKGRAWNLFTQLEYYDQILTKQFLHKWYAGVVWRNEFNNGQGRIFDPLYPPSSTSLDGDRPRSYDDIPGLQQLSFYIQDEITGDLLVDFSLQLGLRYDIFGFKGVNFSDPANFFESNHGSYLNPRVNLVTYLGRNTQVRLGYGKTAKIPPLSMIYPNLAYYDVVDSVYYISAQDNFSIVNTSIFSRENEKIRAETRNKFEASIDQRFGRFGISLTGFYEEAHSGFELSGYNPASLIKYSRPYWPNESPVFPKDTILANYRTAINSMESISRGLELTLQSTRIPLINTTFRINAAYHFSDSWWQDNHYKYATTIRFDHNLNEEVLPFWKPISKKAQQLVFHYRLDTVIKPLKLWFTLSIQQIVFEKDQLTGLEDSLAVGYVQKSGNIVVIPENERDDEVYSNLRRTYDDYNYIVETKPNLWLINLRVSKDIWKGSELSFFVNNLFNYRPLYQRQRVPSGSLSYTRRNPEIYYGVEFSVVVDEFFNYINRF